VRPFSLCDELAAKGVIRAELQLQLVEAPSAHTVVLARERESKATVASLRDGLWEKSRAIEDLTSKCDSAHHAHDAVMEHTQEANVTILAWRETVRSNNLANEQLTGDRDGALRACAALKAENNTLQQQVLSLPALCDELAAKVKELEELRSKFAETQRSQTAASEQDREIHATIARCVKNSVRKMRQSKCGVPSSAKFNAHSTCQWSGARRQARQ
jgi:uncharacterized protein YoxC